MRQRLWVAAVMAFGVTVPAATPAHAYSVAMYYRSDGYHDCLSQTCWISWTSLSAYSHPGYGSCEGPGGSYTSCTFEVSCQTEGWGATSYDLACDDQPPQTCPHTVELNDPLDGPLWPTIKDCRLESYGTVVVPVGTCRDFHARVTTRSPLDAVSILWGFRMCTDHQGPSVVELSGTCPSALPVVGDCWRSVSPDVTSLG